MGNEKIKLEGKISEYQFVSFDKVFSKTEKVQKYFFRDFKDEASEDIIKIPAQQLHDERIQANDAGFEISPIVLEHRGIREQENLERENSIAEEVEKRVAEIQEGAYAAGFEQGILAGREEVLQKTLSEAESKIVQLEGIIQSVIEHRDNLLLKQKKEILAIIRSLTKWVVLKEIDDDKHYLERLLEKLILELQAKSNLLIRVNQKSFDQMPEVLEMVQKRLGALTNVRIESDYSIEDSGIILETENGLIDGTIAQQMKAIDSLYSTMGVAVSD